MQIQKVKTPALVQFTFIAFVLIMMSPFIVYVANASSFDSYCARQFDLSFTQKLHPVAKKCESRFNTITDKWA